jgi:hypothetical protein
MARRVVPSLPRDALVDRAAGLEGLAVHDVSSRRIICRPRQSAGTGRQTALPRLPLPVSRATKPIRCSDRVGNWSPLPGIAPWRQGHRHHYYHYGPARRLPASCSSCAWQAGKKLLGDVVVLQKHRSGVLNPGADMRVHDNR